MMKQLLPVGSVVYLQEGSTPAVIIGLGQLVPLLEGEQASYFDYCGTIYPEGITPETTFYFNHEDIAKVIFTGYESEQHTRYLEAVEEWKAANANSFVVGKVGG